MTSFVFITTSILDYCYSGYDAYKHLSGLIPTSIVDGFGYDTYVYFLGRWIYTSTTILDFIPTSTLDYCYSGYDAYKYLFGLIPTSISMDFDMTRTCVLDGFHFFSI